MLTRLLPWIAQQPFTASYRAFTFGATALATASLRMTGKGDDGAIAFLSPYLFIAANVVTFIMLLGTSSLIAWGRLLVQTSPPEQA